LSLVAGIAIASSLQDYGLLGIQIKWPNDLVCEGKKLGGLLLELVGGGSGTCHVVTGVGINYQLPPSIAEVLDQPWVDLAAFGHVRPGARNRIAGRLMAALDRAYAKFARSGFECFQPAWAQFDALEGERIDVLTSKGVISGRALGINSDGTLRVLVGDQIKRFASAEISVRQSS
jgi:BirA family biotin operon repressor/biotin-[acetyl-CoA-carboxylase] ligase